MSWTAFYGAPRQASDTNAPFIKSSTMSDSASKFDGSRAGEYEQQSRIALAGYEACHELAACILVVLLGHESAARLLIAGAGGGANEILMAGSMAPSWHFTAVDPSP